MAKNITFVMSKKDAKVIAAAAEILQRIATPAEEPIVEEAPAKAKKAAVKKDATAKKAPVKKEAKKETKKTKKSALKKVIVSSNYRISLPYKYLEATGARGEAVDVLRKYGKSNVAYFIRTGADYNTKKYGFVKTVELKNNGVVAIGSLLKGIERGDEVKVDLRGDKIIVRK